MAKKTKSYSQVQATDALEQLGKRGTSASEFIYDLLRIFAGYGDDQIRRIKDGPGNLAKDGETVLIKNLVAYRASTINTLDGDCSAMYDIINAMRDDTKIVKRSPRLYITSNGAYVIAYDPKENDWYENSIDLLFCPRTPEDEVYIMGNPPYLGSSLQSNEQKEDMRIAVAEICSGYKKLDYIATWFIKASQNCKGTISSFAFVTTNSISQGEQVPILWPVLYESGLTICFAYSSFKWQNNAKYNAGVTVAIIGLKSNPTSPILFNQDKKMIAKHINAYLMAFEDIDITPKPKSIAGLQAMIFGSKSSDGGFLILSKEEKNSLISSFPETLKYIKRYVGSDDSINGFERFCIWVEDSQFSEANEIPPLNEKFQGVKNMRLASSKKQTKDMAAFPYKFTEIRYEDTPCLVIPHVSSERREYIPFSFFDRGTVVDGSSQVIYNATLLTFAVINSKMHNLWVRTVGGSLETRIRYSATLCYNTFPFPKLTAADKEELERLARNILNIRDENFDMTLGEMYNPETMPEELREAHHISLRLLSTIGRYMTIILTQDL